MNTKKANANESFMLKGNLSDIAWAPRSEEEVRKDLFKGTDPEKIIDAYEEQLGLKIKEEPKANTLYKSVFLSPCTIDQDQELLSKFYNNPDQYQVLNRSDYWTPRGELKIFLEYMENLDVKKEKEQQLAEESAG
jgi:hypothetical protein